MSLLTVTNSTVFRKYNQDLSKLTNEDKFRINTGEKLHVK